MTTTVPRGAFARLMMSWWRQRARQRPPSTGRADGMRVVVTGGNGGIGYATSQGLLERGANVVIACRNPDRARAAQEGLLAATKRRAEVVACDLSDLDSVAACADAVGPVDVVVCNAGISPRRWASTAQGHESAFGVNVLGHVLLVERLLAQGDLRGGARVVWLTGDIYVLAADASPDFAFSSPWGAVQAYCRSKLGNLWMRHAFAERFPRVDWYAVHPGIAATHLMGEVELSDGARRLVGMIDATDAARTSIRCVVDDLNEGYHHNVVGQVQLPPSDIGADVERALALHDLCRELLASWL